MTFKAANCPSCSGDLQVPDDRDVVKCMYCGENVIVREAIQAAAGGNTKNWLILAKAASQAGNHPEAYEYYMRVLEVDASNSEAWAGKAEAAGSLSTLSSFRLPEMLTGFQKAIDHADPEKQTEVKHAAATKITLIIRGYFDSALAHLRDSDAIDKAWAEYLDRCEAMLAGLDSALSYWPDNPVILDYLIFICRDNIEGVAYLDKSGPNEPVRRVKYITPQYQSKLISKLNVYEAKKRQLNPGYQPPPIQKLKDSSCFVATATMGSAADPTVALLREFRDECLMQSSLGRKFIEQYYRRSPRLAESIAKSRARRLASYFVIVAPSAWAARRLLQRNSSNNRSPRALPE
ncbi:MAG TPA: CFI-box-CTERM domain-containing protein [Pyrinomonadaceae bacterium]|jgi:tetratricopeptide (TPR) repeat protein|nr:CFI-box-CTERM domain-containing protein [Pyrinomonadaceae bacterium]